MIRLLLTVLFVGTVFLSEAKGKITVSDMTCEYLINPLGIDVLQPRLAWKIRQTGEANNLMQTAYQIIVSSSREKLESNNGDLWNSGRVASQKSIQVVYGGKKLESTQRCFWKVKVWTTGGLSSEWSQTASWGMGILKPEDWKAKWIGDVHDYRLRLYVDYIRNHLKKKKNGLFDKNIGDNPPLPASPLIRKSFKIENNVIHARLYVSALGDYELGLNGERAGDHQLAPEWTDYSKRVQYQTYDVTDKIKNGENVISAILADGWYLGKLGAVRWQWDDYFPLRGFYGFDRRLIAQLLIEYADGSTQMIATDKSWKINTDGYITAADNFSGQTIDARKIIPDWDRAGYNDAGWDNVFVDTAVVKNLEAQKNEPIRIHHEIAPVEITKYRDKYIVNFGQNIAGWCVLKVRGKSGAVVTLRHGEWINDDGSIYIQKLGYAKEPDVFILSGGDDCFEPRFTYHGFQYVEISGLETAPTKEMIVARAVSSDVEVVGKFECSNPKLNQLFSNIMWTQRNNMHSVPTDCPQRDERCGWLGDAQVFTQNSIFNMNMAAFYTKFVKDMRDAIHYPSKMFYSLVPSVKNEDFGADWKGAAAYSDAGIIMPWRVYENYADTRILSEHYEAMRNYLESIYADNPDFLWKIFYAPQYNDWLNASTFSDPPENYNTKRGSMPIEVFSTAFFANSARLLSNIAGVLGKSDDAKRYGELADNIAAAFVKHFVDAEGKIRGNTQSTYALALHFDLLPENLRPKAVAHLIECLKEYDYRISTGFVVTPMLMNELVRYGYADLAYHLLESERFPSWLYAVNQGATTVWERWDAYVKGRGIHPSDMNSFDHYSIGSVGEWMYRNILGINPDSSRPGYEHFTINPRLGGKITWAKGSYNSIHGEIASSWKLDGNTFTLDVKIPVNTMATVVLPTANPKDIFIKTGKSPKYTVAGTNTFTELGSGEYCFTVKNVK